MIETIDFADTYAELHDAYVQALADYVGSASSSAWWASLSPVVLPLLMFVIGTLLVALISINNPWVHRAQPSKTPLWITILGFAAATGVLLLVVWVVLKNTTPEIQDAPTADYQSAAIKAIEENRGGTWEPMDKDDFLLPDEIRHQPSDFAGVIGDEVCVARFTSDHDIQLHCVMQ